MDENEDIVGQREAVLLAPYAMLSARSAGRKHPEPLHPYRGPYQRDRDRIVHSAAYRRLAYKTQVFTGEMGDYHRTRLTHTLEVASIARTLARALRLNEDLVEALALLHDVGHPPFGHAGEETLDECLRDAGGFNHNVQALRIVEWLETRYPDFPGLNLTREVLDGQKHRTACGDGDTATRSLLEVQVVDAADSIAYDTHDPDDALAIGLLQIDELVEVPLWRDAVQHVRRRYAALTGNELRRAVVRQLIDLQVGDILRSTQQRLAEQAIFSTADVRRAAPLVAPSSALVGQKQGLETFLFDRVYRHPDILAKRTGAQLALREMFAAAVDDTSWLPAPALQREPTDGRARVVADFLAGMTDRFAWDEYRRLAERRAGGASSVTAGC